MVIKARTHLRVSDHVSSRHRALANRSRLANNGDLSYACLFLSCVAKTNKWVVLCIIARQTSFAILTARNSSRGFLLARTSFFPPSYRGRSVIFRVSTITSYIVRLETRVKMHTATCVRQLRYDAQRDACIKEISRHDWSEPRPEQNVMQN